MTHEFLCVCDVFDLVKGVVTVTPPYRQTEKGGKEGNVASRRFLIFLIFQGQRHLHSTFSFGRLTNRV
jgi:hypothetical protein